MVTFVENIENSINKHAQIPALTDYKGITFTYRQTGEQILRLHSFFEAIGIESGDKIAQIGKNNANWAITFLSTVSYGGITVPLLQDFTSGDIENTVNHSDAILLFISDYIFEKLNIKAFPKIKAFISLDSFNILHSSYPDFNDILHKSMQKSDFPDIIKLPAISNNQMAAISYTSGTSGHSKGVMLTHGNFSTNIQIGFDFIPFQPADKIISFLPLAHAYGLSFEFLAEFANGCNIIFLGKIPSPQTLLQALAEIKPKLVVVVPLIIEKIYRNKIKPAISSFPARLLLGIPLLKQIVYRKINKQLTDSFGGSFYEVIIGGAALNMEVESFLKKIKFRYTVGYGMTECAPLISYTDWKSHRKFSCGQPIPYCEVRIDSPDPENIAGEILVKGSQVMLGYYKNIEATENALKDGWLHTGDLGTLSKEGFITIRGRSKNMILGASGQNIYPEEIEARINNLPFVLESLVVERAGKLHALIVPDIEKAQKEGFDHKTILAEFKRGQKTLNEQMPNYMAIANIELHHEEFIKTPKKSIKRYLYSN